MTEWEEDPIRQAIRDYAYAEPLRLDPALVRRQRAAAERRQRLVRIATAAVVALLIGTVITWIASSRPGSIQPTNPSPTPSASPTPTASPSPSNSPTPTPSASPSPTGFPVQSRAQQGLPTGGLGETVAGLRLTKIDIPEVICGGLYRCPGDSTLTVMNVTDAQVDAIVYFNVWANDRPVTSDGESVSLAPGESTQVTIATQPMLSESSPVGAETVNYSWNFSVELS